jgi:hypothetical protein
MRTIFLIDDYSPYSRNTAEFALQFAEITKAKIVVGTFKVPVGWAISDVSSASVTDTCSLEEEAVGSELISGHLKFLNDQRAGYGCCIDEIEISSMNAGSLAQFINESNVLMVVKSVQEKQNYFQMHTSFDMQAVLNQVIVPVCLVPAGWKPTLFKSLAYLTDLRYCRTDILSHLFKLTDSSDTAVYVAHMAIKGTADLSPDYATTLFSSLAVQSACRQRLFFHHIKQSTSITVADVLVNSMDTDALVLTNHSAHFQQLIGDNLTIKYPEVIRVPLLLYPA